jgi:methylase of polypeptide subunit release factors
MTDVAAVGTVFIGRGVGRFMHQHADRPFDLGDDGFSGGLGRQSAPHSPFRRCLRALIHFFSYHLVLARRSTRETRVAGFRLTVRPTVFHPRYFISSECFAEFIGGLDLKGKCVVDVGTGSGVLALAAARAGAERVVATDINPNAALTAAENARANGMEDCVAAVCSNLLAAFSPRPLFDVVLSSPPKHAGEPRDVADRGWHAGPRYRDIAELFDQARERLKPGGRLYVMVSSDSDLNLFATLIERAGFCARLAHERSIFIESLIIYELRALKTAASPERDGSTAAVSGSNSGLTSGQMPPNR